jgi:hypothetical protein
MCGHALVSDSDRTQAVAHPRNKARSQHSDAWWFGTDWYGLEQVQMFRSGPCLAVARRAMTHPDISSSLLRFGSAASVAAPRSA